MIESTDMEPLNITTQTHRNFTRPAMPEPPLYIIVAASIMYIITFLLGIFGNIHVIVIVFKFKKMRTRMNYFLVNLSVADLFTLLVCIPSAAVDLLAKEVWYFGEIMCKLVPYLENVVTLTSVLTILAITVDRYKGICYPLKYTEASKRVLIGQLICTWLVSMVASIPILFIPVYRGSRFHDGTPVNVCRMPIRHNWQLIYFVCIFAIFFGLMFLMLLFCYVKISHKLSTRQKFINRSADRYAKKILKERRQMIQLMMAVVVMFFVCLVPQRAVSLWLIFTDKSRIYSLGLEGYLLLKTFPRVLVYMNSAINPIIYNFASSKFKHAFGKLLCRHRQFLNKVNGESVSKSINRYNRTEILELTKEDSKSSA